MNEEIIDGRVFIEDAFQIAKGAHASLEDLSAAGYAGRDPEAFKSSVNEAYNWTKKSRGKVWLRTKEGAGKAKHVLDTAQAMRDAVTTPEADAKAAEFAAAAAELGKELSFKVSIIT